MRRKLVGWLAVGVVVIAAVAVLFAMSTEPDSYPTAIGSVTGEPESSHLEVFWGDCAAGGDLEVEESADQIVITATVLFPPGGPCPDIGRIDLVTLDAPLGDREVIDGSSGLHMAVRPALAVEAAPPPSSPATEAVAWCADANAASYIVFEDARDLMPSTQSERAAAVRVDGVVVGTVVDVQEADDGNARRVIDVTLAVDEVIDSLPTSQFEEEVLVRFRWDEYRSPNELASLLRQEPRVLAFLFTLPLEITTEGAVWDHEYGPDTVWSPQGGCPFVFGVQDDGGLVPALTDGPHPEFPGLPSTLQELRAISEAESLD